LPALATFGSPAQHHAHKENNMGSIAKWCGCAALIVAAGAANAGDRGQFQVTPYLGFSKVEVDGRHLEFAQSQTYDGWSAGISVGYRAPFGLLVEIGTSASGEPILGWAAGGELRERYLAAGYDFEFGDDWHFTPKLGVTRWRLEGGDLEELVDDSGQLTDELDSDDVYLELGISKQFNPHVSAGFFIKRADIDVGGATSLAATFTWIP
jgi:hypothetical protein